MKSTANSKRSDTSESALQRKRGVVAAWMRLLMWAIDKLKGQRRLCL